MKFKPTARLFFPLASALAAMLSAQSATAADGTWLGVSGDWTNPTTWSGGTVADGNGFTAFFTGVNITTDQAITLTAPQTIGNITFTDVTTSNNLLITGGSLLTLDVSSGIPTINVTQSNRTLTIDSVIAGTVGLRKIGTGTLTLNGSAVNTFTGGLSVNGGALALDFTNLAVPTNLVDTTNALQINSGVLTLTGQNVAAATSAQTFASTSFGGATNTVNIAKGALATSATLNLGALTVNAGSATTFNPTTLWTTTASTAQKAFITAGGSVPSLPGSGTAFVNAGVFARASDTNAGSLRLAAVNSSGQLLLKSSGTLATGTVGTPADSYLLNAGSISLANTASIYGLLLNATGAGTNITVANSGTLTLNSVIQIQATESVNFNAGTGTSNIVIGAEKNLVIAMDNEAGVTFNAIIANNGSSGGTGGTASGVTIVGTAPSGTTPGGVTFGGANTYTGATTITRGTLALSNANALATTSGLTLGGTSAATLTNSGDVNNIVINGPITAANSGVTSTIAYGRTSPNQGSITLSGGITGGGGNVTFTTISTTSGGSLQTIVLGGSVGSAGGYGGNTTLGVGNNGNAITLRSGIANALPTTTVLTFSQNNGGGSGRATTFDLNGNNQTLAGLTNGGVVPEVRSMVVTSAAAATLTINNTANFTFGGRTISTTIANLGVNTRAQISGAISLVKSGSGTFTLGGTLAGGAVAGGNSFTGSTTVLGGILVLGETLSIQNSAFDTAASIAGDLTNGLRTTDTTLRLGGLTGSKNFADVFTTTSGGYSGLTALTLNPGTGVTNSYAADIGNGAGAMTLTKSGAGTQILTAAQTYNGNTTVSVGTLRLDSAPDPLNANTGNDASTVTIAATGATLDLTYTGTDKVDKLFIGGVQQAAGIYGPTGINIPQITNSSGSGTLTVATGPAGFASWIAGTFTGGATVPSGKQGPNDDPDNDGIRNLVEYAVAGQDPTVSSPTVGTYTGTSLSFAKRADASGLTYAIEESSDLSLADLWAEVTHNPPTSPYVNDATTISYTFTPGTPAKDFFRLQVTQIAP